MLMTSVPVGAKFTHYGVEFQKLNKGLVLCFPSFDVEDCVEGIEVVLVSEKSHQDSEKNHPSR
jgi:hypothetical protein